MKLHSIIPNPSISNYVSKIFAIEDCKVHFDIGFPLIANGYPGFVFQETNSELTSSGNQKVDSLFLFGQTIRPVELFTAGNLTLIAYFFYPHTLQTFFGFSASELTDINIDLNYLQPARDMNLREQLINATSLSMRLQLMNNYVLKLAEPNYSNIQNNIFFATHAIRKNNGLIALKTLHKELGVSERTLRRLFDFHVGVSPRMFTRICQFDSAFQQLNNSQFSRLSDVAYENGYADQSHLTRSFKEFTNLTPSEYLKKSSDFLMLNS
jgi:AraC-like DNA-binding protein